MHYQNIEKAMKLAQQCSDYEVDTGISAWQIRKAEKMLGIRFSKQIRDFYKKYNYLAFRQFEVYGINPDSSFPVAGNAVATALADRKQFGLPEKWVPLCFLDDGYYAYADYSHLNVLGEPRIIEAIYTDGESTEASASGEYCNYMITEVLGEDFGEFLLALVEEALEEEHREQIETTEPPFAVKPLNEWDNKLKSLDDELDEVDRLLAELRKMSEKNNL